MLLVTRADHTLSSHVLELLCGLGPHSLCHWWHITWCVNWRLSLTGTESCGWTWKTKLEKECQLGCEKREFLILWESEERERDFWRCRQGKGFWEEGEPWCEYKPTGRDGQSLGSFSAEENALEPPAISLEGRAMIPLWLPLISLVCWLTVILPGALCSNQTVLPRNYSIFLQYSRKSCQSQKFILLATVISPSNSHMTWANQVSKVLQIGVGGETSFSPSWCLNYQYMWVWSTSCSVLVHSTHPALQLAEERELSWLKQKNRDERWSVLVTFEALVMFVSRPALPLLPQRLTI